MKSRTQNSAHPLLKAPAWALLLLFLTAGCGYRFAPAGGTIDSDLQKVYVGVFTNNTAEANIETAFRNAFIDQFIKGRRFKAVNTEEGADAVLKGDIKNLAISHLAYRGGNFAVEQRMTVTISIAFQRRDTKKILWSEQNFSQWGDFTVDRDITAGAKSQSNALIKLANDTAERAYRMMVADF